MRKLIFILVIGIGFSACKKEAGEGGTSVIEGKVLDDMGIHKYCCRIPFLSTVHLITSI